MKLLQTWSLLQITANERISRDNLVDKDYQIKITLSPWSCQLQCSPTSNCLTSRRPWASASFQSLSDPPPMGPGTGIAAFLDISFNIMKV